MTPVARSLTDLPALAPAWREVETAVRLPTQTPSWVRACAETFHAAGGLTIVTTDDGGAVAPLCVRGRRLGLLGVAQLGEPTDLLAVDGDRLHALAREVIRVGRPLELDRLPADSPTVAALRRASRRRASVSTRPREGSPWIALDETWREPEAKLSSRRRADLRRALRRAESHGPVRVEVLAPTAETLEESLDAAWDVEARSWRAHREGALAQDPLRGPFYRRWAQLAADDGTLRIALLYAGETAIAMQLAVAVAGGYWLLKIGFDEAYKRCSPGMLLIAETIRRAAEAGLSTYELMGIVEPWTHMWTERVRECVSLRIYPWSASGASAFAGDAARALWARRPGARP